MFCFLYVYVHFHQQIQWCILSSFFKMKKQFFVPISFAIIVVVIITIICFYNIPLFYPQYIKQCFIIAAHTFIFTSNKIFLILEMKAFIYFRFKISNFIATIFLENITEIFIFSIASIEHLLHYLALDIESYHLSTWKDFLY